MWPLLFWPHWWSSNSPTLIFAIDSVPAILAVSKRRVLGLFVQRLRHPWPTGDVLPARRRQGTVPLPSITALGFILIFVGIKMTHVTVGVSPQRVGLVGHHRCPAGCGHRVFRSAEPARSAGRSHSKDLTYRHLWSAMADRRRCTAKPISRRSGSSTTAGWRGCGPVAILFHLAGNSYFFDRFSPGNHKYHRRSPDLGGRYVSHRLGSGRGRPPNPFGDLVSYRYVAQSPPDRKPRGSACAGQSLRC